MSYRQLTPEQRYQIEAGLGTGMTKKEIAKWIGVHRSTVYREIGRNSNMRLVGYKACPAERAARERHKQKKKHRIEDRTRARVEELLRIEWSPEQISRRLQLEGYPTVSHETIYQHIFENKRDGGDLYKHLRRRHAYRKPVRKYCKRVGWDTRRPIRERPAIVDERIRVGDWEADTIIGGGRRGAILSLVERRSRFVVLEKVASMSSVTVAEAFINKLLPLKDKVFTITSDNGIEFTRHQTIARSLGADFFFADPYSSWQRGTNENTNGLVRQYFPKKSDFTTLTRTDIQHVCDRLNNRPRKTLAFRTPNEVFTNNFVALIT